MSQTDKTKAFARFVAAGPLVLFLLASLYGALDRNVSNDLWVSLATGQYILEHGEVPTTDPFSYTFAGKEWFNPNWLSHVILYSLYKWLGPDGFIISTWLISISIFILAALAIHASCRSWPAALVGTSFLSLASHGYFTPRPATIAYLCFAALTFILISLAHTDKRKRLWPALMLFPLLLFWGNAHGSFVFAYGLAGLFVVCAGWTHFSSRAARLCTQRQLAVVIGSSVAALLLTLLFGPYGLDNFILPFKMLGNKAFVTVGEWVPPYLPVRGTPVRWFWISIAAGLASSIFIWLLGRAGKGHNHQPEAEGPGPLQIYWFDILAALAGLLLALLSRRFIPLFFILALPMVMTWLTKSNGSLSTGSRLRLQRGVLTGIWIGAVALVWFLLQMTTTEYIEPYKHRPQYNLFDRAIVYEEMPDIPLEFLNRNELPVNLFTHWNASQLVMWKSPTARLFIDARATQVYPGEHLANYRSVLITDATQAPAAMQILRQSNTNALLLQARPDMAPLMRELDTRRDWIPVFFWDHWVIYLRRGSAPLAQLKALERTGKNWWPEPRSHQIGVGNEDDPVVMRRALYYYTMAIAKMPALGINRYMPMTRALIKLGQPRNAEKYLAAETKKLSSELTGIDAEVRRRLLETIDNCRQVLSEQRSNES